MEEKKVYDDTRRDEEGTVDYFKKFTERNNNSVWDKGIFKPQTNTVKVSEEVVSTEPETEPEEKIEEVKVENKKPTYDEILKERYQRRVDKGHTTETFEDFVKNFSREAGPWSDYWIDVLSEMDFESEEDADNYYNYIKSEAEKHR